MLGNTTEEAIIAINEHTIKLAARASLPNGPEIDLPPGRFKVPSRCPALRRGTGISRSVPMRPGAC
jgi:hypothetical protein